MAVHSLSPEALRRFLAGTAGPQERKEIARHLLQGCRTCRGFFRKLLPTLDSATASIGPSYQEAFEKAHQVIHDLGSLTEPRRLLLELLSHPFPRQEILVQYQRRYWTVPFCELLVSESHEARFADPAEMQRLARLAVLAAERLGSAGDAQEISDCRASAWMAFGNALRATGELNSADRALFMAWEYLADGEGSLALRADLLGKVSSLRCNQRRFEDALTLSREDIDIRRDLYSPEDVAYSLTKHAMSLGEGGRPAEAIAYLQEAEKMAKRAENSRLNLIIRHNLIGFELVGGNPELAHQHFLDAEPLYQKITDPLIQFKATWLKGSIFSSLGHNRIALDHLFAARQDSLEQRNMLDAAWLGLDCAVVLARLGRKEEVRRLAAAALREFGARGIQRDYLAALVLLRQAS